MNYKKIYDNLIEKAKLRNVLNENIERHHIIPKCIGGSDVDENIVSLTVREHFIAHLLLSKIYGGKLTVAAYLMSTINKYTSRKYEKLKNEFINGIRTDTERAKKISKSLTGRKKTKEHREAYKKSRASGAGWVCPEHKKQTQRESMKGEGNPMWRRTHNEVARNIISEANKQQIICPHCGKVGAIAIMKRWHFDNCKHSPNPKERRKYAKRTCPHCGKVGGGAQMTAKHFDNCKDR